MNSLGILVEDRRHKNNQKNHNKVENMLKPMYNPSVIKLYRQWKRQSLHYIYVYGFFVYICIYIYVKMLCIAYFCQFNRTKQTHPSKMIKVGPRYRSVLINKKS